MIITSEIKNKVIEICKEMLGENAQSIYVDCETFEYGCDDEVIFLSNIEQGNEWYIQPTDDCDIYCGACKLVISPKHEDFVIKIDIENQVYEEVDEDDKGEYRKWRVDLKVQDYHRALALESSIFESSDEDLRKVLLPVKYVLSYNSIPIYIQPKFKKTIENSETGENINYKYKIFNQFSKSILKGIEYLTNLYNFREYNFMIYDNWIKRFGFNTAIKIAKSIAVYDINDLHGSNVVFDDSGLIKLADFAGYSECDHWYEV